MYKYPNIYILGLRIFIQSHVAHATVFCIKLLTKLHEKHQLNQLNNDQVETENCPIPMFNTNKIINLVYFYLWNLIVLFIL